MSKQSKAPKPSGRIKAVITLYGNPDSGKTATLRYLYYLLNHNTSPVTSKIGARDFFGEFKYTPNNGSISRTIAMASAGDSQGDVSFNWGFFTKNPADVQNSFRKGRRIIPKHLISPLELPEIVVEATRVKDRSSIISDQIIARIKGSLNSETHIRKWSVNNNPNTKTALRKISEQDWVVLLGHDLIDRGKWTDEMASDAIDTAVAIKDLIDWIIG
jgi:hypothetical protein